MNQANEKLPLEYPVGEMLKIYGRRLLVFLSVVVANLILLGLVVLVLEVKMNFMLDFLKTNLLQLLNLLVVTLFGAAGWQVVNEWKKNLEERYKAELAKREVQIESLKAENKLLKETQYDRALSLIKSQQEVYEIERKDLEEKIAALQSSTEGKEEELQTARIRLGALTENIQTLERSREVLQSEIAGVWGGKVTLTGPPNVVKERRSHSDQETSFSSVNSNRDK